MFIKTLKGKEILKFLICIAFILILTAMPQLSLAGAADGLYLCSRAVIPSVFPFMVLSKYIIYSGGAAKLSGLIGKPASKLFGFPEDGASALVLGIAGGYPIGASGICDLVKSKQISKSCGELMLPYCNNASPLFVIGTVGSVLLGSKAVGIILYIIHIFSSFICALIYKKGFPPQFKVQKNTAPSQCRTPFITAVSDASTGTIIICGYILFFSVINKAAAILPLKSDLLHACIYGFFELSNGAQAISCLTLNPVFKYALTSAFLGFSGICVYLQVSASVKEANLSMKPYICGKLICAAVSFVLAYVVFGLMGIYSA